MADEGSKRVEIVGADDKRQITFVFAITPLGDFLVPAYPMCVFLMVLMSAVQKTTG